MFTSVSECAVRYRTEGWRMDARDGRASIQILLLFIIVPLAVKSAKKLIKIEICCRLNSPVTPKIIFQPFWE